MKIKEYQYRHEDDATLETPDQQAWKRSFIRDTWAGANRLTRLWIAPESRVLAGEGRGRLHKEAQVAADAAGG